MTLPRCSGEKCTSQTVSLLKSNLQNRYNAKTTRKQLICCSGHVTLLQPPSNARSNLNRTEEELQNQQLLCTVLEVKMYVENVKVARKQHKSII